MASNINRAEIHETTWSGPWAVPQQGNVVVTQISNQIILNIPNIEEVSDAPAVVTALMP